jgi:putative radical SAM enzyme (TIGR03279 family)
VHALGFCHQRREGSAPRRAAPYDEGAGRVSMTDHRQGEVQMTGVAIIGVGEGSLGEKLGLLPGDRILAMNGQPVRDLLDVQFYGAAEELELVVARANGEEWELTVGKDAGVGLGLELQPMEIQTCENNCVFCFVYQNPRGQRRSLYIKDEDYRFSFLHGHYITLSNLTDEEYRRIIEQRLSPLYVSVHATDPGLRAQLLRGQHVAPVLPQLQRLIEGGITLHTQIVLCPGINDDSHFRRTIDDLAALHPGVRSVAVVPVGLTDHRKGLPVLQRPDKAYARQFLAEIEALQGDCLSHLGTRFVFAADEWFVLAGMPLPPAADYEGYPQIADGVGSMAWFREELEAALGHVRPSKGRFCFFTGKLFGPTLERHVATVQEISAGWLGRVVSLENRFFGSGITVAGLLSGDDLRRGLALCRSGEIPVIPDVLLAEDRNTFLDSVTVADLRREIHPGLRVVATSAAGLLSAGDDQPMCHSVHSSL